MNESADYMKRPYGQMAYDQIHGLNTQIMFLHGFKSDRKGSKSLFLKQLCQKEGWGYTAIDMMAHGESDGTMHDFTLSDALDDIMTTLDTIIEEPVILVGSSMGGWLGLRAAEERNDKIKAFIGLAAAPDFTAEIAARMDEEQLATIATQGYITQESGYDEPYIFTRKLIEDGQQHLLLHRLIDYHGPAHFIQGMQDDAVDWRKADRIASCLPEGAGITLIDDGDHSLSRPSDLAILEKIIRAYS